MSKRGRSLKQRVITDAVQPTEAMRVAGNIRVLSIATLIGEAIGRTASEESMSSLFDGFESEPEKFCTGQNSGFSRAPERAEHVAPATSRVGSTAYDSFATK